MADVVLEPGDGARALVEGEDAGRTDADGRFEARSRDVRVEHRDWVVVRSPADADGLVRGSPWQEFVLAPLRAR